MANHPSRSKVGRTSGIAPRHVLQRIGAPRRSRLRTRPTLFLAEHLTSFSPWSKPRNYTKPRHNRPPLKSKRFAGSHLPNRLAPALISYCPDLPDPGWSVTFCTRQFRSSPTVNSFSLRQSSELTEPKSFGPLPALPNLPTTVPSSSIL